MWHAALLHPVWYLWPSCRFLKRFGRRTRVWRAEEIFECFRTFFSAHQCLCGTHERACFRTCLQVWHSFSVPWCSIQLHAGMENFNRRIHVTHIGHIYMFTFTPINLHSCTFICEELHVQFFSQIYKNANIYMYRYICVFAEV